MTALDKYVRLESDALWCAAPDAQRRDVVVSFGDATLVISDGTGRPLAHWSLPALIRQNPDEMPAIYTPDDAASEHVEIRDDTMITAIEDLRQALAKTRPHPGRLRYGLLAGMILITCALAVFWLPGALARQTLAVVPASKRIEIGTAVLRQITADTGPVCDGPQAGRAAERLAARLFGVDRAVQIIVVPQLAQGVIALPGGLILLDDGVLQASDDPAAAAGFILASMAVVPADPLARLLHDAGLGVTFRLLTTGDIPDAILRAHARDMQQGQSMPNPDLLRDMMITAQVPQAPYRAVVDARSGSMPDLGDDPLTAQDTPLILTDSDWVSLQNICNR